ncbi:MAG: hypothetical protein WCC36_14090 [Gammaproteobacteria bacterium]
MARSASRSLLLCCVLLWSGWPQARAASDGAARAALLSQYQLLTHQALAVATDLYLRSEQSGNSARGDVFAVVNYPFASISPEFRKPSTWCDILLLHFNVKACVHDRVDGNSLLTLYLGRKYYQAADQAYQIKGRFRIEKVESDYLHVSVTSDDGPLGLKNYTVVLRATPLTSDRTLLSFSYSFTYGDLANWLMQGYFATFGQDKVGFTTHEVDGKPELVTGIKGAVERNAMRYYLAIDAYLDTLNAPPDRRFDLRLQRWFALTQRYPRQLQEMDRTSYLTQKHKEFRQQVALQHKIDG